MQLLNPLKPADFKDKSNIVISKVEIDSDGAGTYLELPDVLDFSISTNIENQVGRLCSYSFSMTVLNTDNQFHPYNTGSSYYDYLRQGRRIKLYTGLKVGETEKDFQQILGRIDDYRLSERAGQDICTITGRCLMRIITEYRLYYPNTYWGTNIAYNTVANKIRYNMEDDCKGVYKVELDYTNKDGTALEEIYENTDWSYDWHNNQLVFTPRRIPDFAGTDNLKVYYFQTQTVEDVVGHILYVAGIFADTDKRDNWIANASYVTPTSKTIDRVWFNTGTSALEAIRLLSEVVRYRLYFDYEGKPVFKPKAGIGSSVDTFLKSDITIEDIEENEEETYTHIIVIGEERDRILGEDEIAPATPTGLTLSTGLGLPTQASLAWIKAEWDANTESDFGHYELRIRKIGDSDFTEVSTTAITFIWYSLEPGVEYSIIIRAVDIYNNRSDWSSEETILTATDETEPAQITGAVATALLAGIKVTWGGATEGDIAGYIIERQESDNGTTWVGDWIERARINATMWLDLLLTYATYYRYTVKAYTQTGVEGPASTPTADSIKPNQAGSDDIVFNAITGDHIAVNKLDVISADMGTITAGTITLNTTGFIRSYGKTYGSSISGFWMGYSAGAYKLHIGTITKYLMWDGANLTIKGVTTTDALSSISANIGVITAGSLQISSTGYIRTVNKTSYADTTAGFWLGYEGGAYKLNIGNATRYLKWDGSVIDLAGNIKVGGFETDQEIYFKDSQMYLYDKFDGNNQIIAIRRTASPLDYFRFYRIIGGHEARLEVRNTDGVITMLEVAMHGIESGMTELSCNYGGYHTKLYIISSGVVNRNYFFWDTGTLQLPQLESAPTAHVADLTYHIDEGDDPHFHGYIGPPDNTWGKISLTAPNW